MRKVIWAAGVLVCLCVASVDADLVNTGFETGSLSPWYTGFDYGATEAWNVTSADAHSGTYSATNVGDSEIRQTFAPVPASEISELSYWVKEPGTRFVFSGFNLYYEGYYFASGYFAPSEGEWQYVDLTSYLEPGLNLTGVGVWGYEMPSASWETRTYVDDFTLTAVPAPGALMLAALGTTVFACVRRRRARLTLP